MNPSFFTRLGSLCLMVAALSLTAPTAIAQNYAEQLQRLEERQRVLNRKQEALRTRSQELSVEMANVEPVEGPEKAAYDEAVASFEEASENYENDPSPTNKARLRNAEFKLHLAERKLRQANEQLSALEQQQEEVEGELADVRRELASIQRKIPETREALARQRAERQRQLAAQRAQNASDDKPATEAKAEQPRKELAARSSDNAGQKKKPSPARNSGDPIELDRHFTLLTNKAQVLTALANLELRIGGDGMKIRSNKILNIRHFVDGEEVDKNSHRFKGLGNYQYRATAVMKPGENRVRVSFNRWNVNLPEQYGDQELVFLMDATNRHAPKIVCYPARLVPEEA